MDPISTGAKGAVNTLKSAQSVGKDLSTIVVDQQANIEATVNEQHRIRVEAKLKENAIKSAAEFKAFEQVPLTSLVIPNTVTEIGYGAFEQSKLVSVTIPDSVRVMGASVFKDNTALTSISLPDGLRQIGVPAFAGNYALTAIYFCGSFPSGTFPITQNCPPDRQAVLDAAKAAADKAAADKAAADKAAADAKSKKLTTITCVKGKLTKKVTAVKPVCPAGFKKKG